VAVAVPLMLNVLPEPEEEPPGRGGGGGGGGGLAYVRGLMLGYV